MKTIFVVLFALTTFSFANAETQAPADDRPIVSGYDIDGFLQSGPGLLANEQCPKPDAAHASFIKSCKKSDFEIIFLQDCEPLCSGPVTVAKFKI